MGTIGLNAELFAIWHLADPNDGALVVAFTLVVSNDLKLGVFKRFILLKVLRFSIEFVGSFDVPNHKPLIALRNKLIVKWINSICI